MSAHKQQRIAELSLVVPLGQEGWWQAIRALDAKRPWSVAEIFGETIHCSHKQTVHDYVRRLVKGGFAQVVEERDSTCRTPEKLYRLTKRPAEAPSLRRDGTALPQSGTLLMWIAIRNLRQFDVHELRGVVGQIRPLQLSTVKRYVQYLAAAGYLTVFAESRPGLAAIWRLKPRMDTGPLPPKILRAHVVWDSNRNVVMGGPYQASEVTI
jgi:hypothetical protein